VRGVCDAGRAGDVALYTGNDDNILLDLLTRYQFEGREARFTGGLLGHWAVWTSKAVAQLDLAHSIMESRAAVPDAILTMAQEITDSNAALFDVASRFHGCIAGIHEILRRQGLLEGRWCLDPNEDLSPGQMEEIDRVCQAYPHLQDNEFVEEHRDEWLA
jgi:hypothetical protein